MSGFMKNTDAAKINMAEARITVFLRDGALRGVPAEGVVEDKTVVEPGETAVLAVTRGRLSPSFKSKKNSAVMAVIIPDRTEKSSIGPRRLIVPAPR